MARRWSVAGQLLALQLGIIAVVLVGVGGVSLAQAQIDFRRTEGARVLSAAESLAARTLLRQALSAPSRPERVLQSVPIADGVQSLSGVTFVEIADADGVVVANTRDPARLGVSLSPADTGDAGRSWVADSSGTGGKAIVAHVPVFGEVGAQTGRVVGTAAVGQEYPSLGESLLSAVPNLLTYLGLAGIVGVAGSLLVARRVKRQTLGPGAGRDPRPGRASRGDAHRDQGGRPRPRPRRPRDAGQRRGRPDAGPAGRLRRTDAHRARRRGPVARRAHRQRRAAGRRGLRGRADPHAQPQAGRGPRRPGRLGHDHARPDRAAGAGAGAGRHPADDGGAARPGARVRQPPAHDQWPAGARGVRRGAALREAARLRDPGTRGRGDRAHREPAARRAAHRQVQRGGRAGDPAAPGRREPGRAARRGPGGGPGDRRRQPRGQRAGRRRAPRRRRGRRVRAGGGRRGDGRGPRLGPRGGARAGRGGLHQRLHDQGRRGRLPRLRPGADPRALRPARRLGQRAQRRRRGLRRPPAPARGRPERVR